MKPFMVLTILQGALKERGIDTMIEEGRVSNRENDADHLRRDH
jgi:hypothetical protein